MTDEERADAAELNESLFFLAGFANVEVELTEEERALLETLTDDSG